MKRGDDVKKILLKLIPLFTALLCSILFLFGCSENKLTVTVNETGGTIVYEYYINKEIADEYFGSELPDGLKVCEVDEIDGIVCYIHSEKFSVQTFPELEKKLCTIAFYGEENMTPFNSASINNRKLSLTVNPFVTEDIKDIALIQDIELTEIAKLSLTITMPYEIEQYSDGTLSEDKQTITVELSNFDTEKTIQLNCIEEIKETVFTTITPKNSVNLPLILCSSILILTSTAIIVVFLTIKKRRKKAKAMPETPIDKF